MPNELMLCVPGPWKDRNDFIRAVVTAEPVGQWMFAGMVLADVVAKEHIPLELESYYQDMDRAFEIAGQGKLTQSVISQITQHKSTAYLRFPVPLPEQRMKILKFSRFLQSIGGLAIKVESTGVAHTWERWFELLESGDPFDWYYATVVLIGDKDFYYSCGMQNFQLADSEISCQHTNEVAAEMLNNFNYWRLAASPLLDTGHTFSLNAASPHFKIELMQDRRHDKDDPFYNPDGIWRLNKI